MPRTTSNQDFDNFDDWETLAMDDDIYLGAEMDSLDDWEDDGAIAEVKEPEPIIKKAEILEDFDNSSIELDDESAEVFSLLEKAQSKRARDLLAIDGPSEDELSRIEEVGIDDYIDIVLSEESDGVSGPDASGTSALSVSDHTSNDPANVRFEAPEASVLKTEEISDFSERAFAASEETIGSERSEGRETASEGKAEISSGDTYESDLITKPLFEGVAVSLPTLFDEDGEVEYKTSARLANRLCQDNVNAVFVATTDCEGYTLSRKERKNLAKTVTKNVDGVVVLDISAPSIRQSVQLTEDALDVGVENFVLTLDRNTKDPYLLCESIHNLNKQTNIFVRLEGDPLDLPITPEFLYDLPIAGVIDATGDIKFFIELISSYSGPVYVGTTSMISAGKLLGAAGVVTQTAAVMPDLVEKAFDGDAQSQLELSMWERETGSSGSKAIKIALESEFLVSSTMRD